MDLANIANVVKELIMNNALNIVLGIFGLGSVYMLGDNILGFFVKELFKREKIVLNFIDMLDEVIDNQLEKKFPKSHKDIERRLLLLCDKIKAKIKD